MSKCLEFRGLAASGGYAVLVVDGLKDRAHRHVWRGLNGAIAQGVVIRHSCDNVACLNPEHLLSGRQLDNIQDRVRRGRCAKGLQNARTKMTPSMIAYVLASSASSRALGKELGVSHMSIVWARNGKTTLSSI